MNGLPVCPRCSGPMRQAEKDTFSGRVMRTYRCEPCGLEEVVDEGKALWAILHDENEASEEKKDEEKKP